MALPTRTPEQRQQALAHAAETRRERAAALKQLQRGAITLQELDALADRSRAIAGTPVVLVIRSLSGYGPVRAEQLMRQLRISPNRRLRGLGHRQLEALADVINGGS